MYITDAAIPARAETVNALTNLLMQLRFLSRVVLLIPSLLRCCLSIPEVRFNDKDLVKAQQREDLKVGSPSASGLYWLDRFGRSLGEISLERHSVILWFTRS